ncbi:precorrin-6y C5,15-methyltransferase (decarboxylating), CbiE subunit / precorrin-6Y C5,15-methyltransferase (decarboxylating), CbiT subunit multi-domain protein [Leptospira broomii serovar Hurstbridge str. 5399]|uniref:Precorrin-6y C5,15-methyltransferase (Decarboxylating), CbiE subunit / precorrin-6Y C5,15-methyltransferase (Decarboxylating), CbiT subunit multi-domain protein n=1 Tax=Leptospira broomii serovar Hurstbridge str. 5399 TaxID=1049789 RepID=T0GFX8_9LEPT|nr:bifunctional cobalt-precorrin-7 (C(5))-methyltransferase/cobalt-precorrin-6B (C(15))-methyltransferase [Leptospira broomii]EQA44303.1 precorrin-6y C5,15-methyltransferase (decarboxylating), CbiE subunit / precorrin-6Y C5,15-methyltransferase (decarboxylating), CbiT subunit multi-domain protein [Leptospira broomii serovar Hurstbridge str. 5399]
MKAVVVVGIGDDGCVGLSSQAMGAVARANILAGGERHLDFFPEFDGKRITLKENITAAIDHIAELSGENTICILASGDPLFYGIGNLVRKKIGADHVEFIPAPSSMQRAFAKVGINWDDAKVISMHGRDKIGFVNKLKFHNKIACFTDGSNSPSSIARNMIQFGETDWIAFVCENLGGRSESVRKFTISELSVASDISDLNVLILIREDAEWRRPSVIPYREEDEYAKRIPKKGLITKKEVRILSLAALEIRIDSVVWDIGAGSGSVSIEAAFLASEGRAYAIEIDPEGIAICQENKLFHKADNVFIIEGRAPEALADLPSPDCVFVGGSKGSLEEIIRVSYQRLKEGGRLVVNAVTLDNVSEAYQAFKNLGLEMEVILLNVSRGQKLATYLRYEALNPIHIFKTIKRSMEL